MGARSPALTPATGHPGRMVYHGPSQLHEQKGHPSWMTRSRTHHRFDPAIARVLLAGIDTIHVSAEANVSEAVRAKLDEAKEAAQFAAKENAVHCPDWLGAQVHPTWHTRRLWTPDRDRRLHRQGARGQHPQPTWPLH